MNTYQTQLRHKFLVGLIKGLKIVWPVLSAILAAIVLLGVIVGQVEGWSIGDSIYFAFITAMTIGYGDFAPHTPLTKTLSVFIGLFGVLLTALLAGLTVRALTAALYREEEEE